MVDQSRIRAKGKRVRWSDDEWRQMAEVVWIARKNNQEKSLLALANSAIKQLPKDRQRKIISMNNIKPLIEHIQRRDKEMSESHQKIESLKQAIQDLRNNTTTKQEVLETLTDSEIMHYFADRVWTLTDSSKILHKYTEAELLNHIPLSKLAGYVASSFTEKLSYIESVACIQVTNNELPSRNGHTKSKPDNRPTLLIIGALDRQHAQIFKLLDKIAKVTFLKKDRDKDISANYDHYLLWARFSSHGVQDKLYAKVDRDRVIIYHGGINGMLDTMIKQMQVVV